MTYPWASTSEKHAIGNISYHPPPAYSISNNKIRSRSPSLNSQEGEQVNSIIKQELQGVAINENDYILQK